MKLKKFPDTLVLLFVILFIFIILTWILPAGEFARTELNGRSVVVPGSYTSVAAAPQGIDAFFMAPIRGFIGAAQIIAFVFLVGGAFSMLNRTGAVDAGLQQIIRSSHRNPGLKKWVIPIVMTLFSLCGATFGMSEEVLVFVLITIPLSQALGYDTIVGVAISFVGAGAGFAGAFLNPFTIGIAQGIAELPPFSGIEYRLVVWLLMTLIAIIFVMRYAQRILKDPTKSVVYNTAATSDLDANNVIENIPFTNKRKLILLLLFAAIGILIIGVTKWDWYINEITGLFVAMGIGAVLIGRLSVDASVAAFKQGAKDMMVPALVIALAKGLIIIASDGKIIDTILDGIASTAEGVPQGISVQIMFLLQSFLNVFVPSGSGQAALTMPIMAPLSDLLEINRQVAVLAFQFGDGLTNLIIPTSGVTMGVLAIAKIRYDVWLKWMFPLFVILSIAAMVLLALPMFFDIW